MTDTTLLQTILGEIRQEMAQAAERIAASNEQVAASNLALAQALRDLVDREPAAPPSMGFGDQVFLGHINRTE